MIRIRGSRSQILIQIQDFLMKFLEGVAWFKNNRLYFGGDMDHDPEPGFPNPDHDPD